MAAARAARGQTAGKEGAAAVSCGARGTQRTTRARRRGAPRGRGRAISLH